MEKLEKCVSFILTVCVFFLQPTVLTYSHHFDVFFLCEAATINFTFSFQAYFDYNHFLYYLFYCNAYATSNTKE
jgi:hypothetical protein